MEEPRFLADENVGKLGRRLRMAGFDTMLFGGPDDGEMARLAAEQGRIVLTRDTRFFERKLVLNGTVKAMLLTTGDTSEQFRKVVTALGLADDIRPFTRCIEDNRLLLETDKETVKNRLPPFVLLTQEHFMECPECRRIYWRGTHWRAMKTLLTEASAT